MKNKKLRFLCYFLAVLGVVVTALLYTSLPELIPTQWGIDGSATLSPKSRIWTACGMLPLFAVLFDFVPHIDPKKKNYVKFSGYYDGFCVFLQLFLLLMLAITLCESLYPGRISVGRVVMVVLGCLFLFIGNMLPKIKSNFYMGIKTPWAISDEENWYKTHRLAGKTMFSAGAVTILIGWFLPLKVCHFLLLGLISLAVLIPIFMSFIWWRQKQQM